MPFVFNATNETQTIKAAGNWISFKPKQVKSIYSEHVAHFICTERADKGLISVSDAFEDPQYALSAEGKAELAEKETAGINNFIRSLEGRIYNNQVSLRQDLERANFKIDPAVLASEGELEAMRLLAKYRKVADESAQKRMDEVADLMKQVGDVKRDS